MDSKSSAINLKKLIDLAIGSPDAGTVNFNALHTILHAFAEILGLKEINVDVDSSLFREVASSCVEVSIQKHDNGQATSVDQMSSNNIENVTSNRLQPSKLQSDSEEMIENLVNLDFFNQENLTFSDMLPVKVDKVREKGGSDDINQDKKTILVKNKFPLSRKPKQCSHQKYDIELNNQNVRLHTTERQKGGSDDVRDNESSNYKEETNNMEMNEDTVLGIKNILDEAIQNINNLKIDNDDLKYSFQNLVSTIGTLKLVFDEFQCEKLKETVEAIQKDFFDFKCNINYQKCKDNQPENLGTYHPQSTKTFDHVNEQIMFLENESDKTIKQVMFLKKDICKLADRIEEIAESSSKRRSSSGINLSEIHQEINTLKDYIGLTNATLSKISSEQQNAAKVIQCLAKTNEDLSKHKLDKDEIDELLAEKADYVVLQRKVSTEYVDGFRKNLENQINEVLLKMEENISLLSCKIKSINADLEKQKKDQTFADFKCKTEKDLAMLKEKLSEISAIKKDVDAAGTKLRCLRNVNCISCNQDAVMKTMEANAIGKLEKQKPSSSISPAIAFELNELRLSKDKIKNKNKDNDKLLEVNRFCGGSHTKINMSDTDNGLKKGFSSSS